LAEEFKNRTNKELLRMIIHRIESLDERERLLQREMARVLTHLETEKDWSREKAVLVGWFLTLILFIIEIVLRVMGY